MKKIESVQGLDEIRFIGVSYLTLAAVGLVINLVVLEAIRRCGLFRGEPNNKNSNTVFLLAGVSLFDCLVRHSITGGYFGTSILLQRRWGGESVCFHLTQLVIISWAVGSITEFFIALNRLFAIMSVCGSVWAGRMESVLFTRRNCLFYAVGIYPLQGSSHYALLAVTPCCK